MALIYKDRVKETTTTTGQGTLTLAGAVTGFQAFSVVGNSNTCHYTLLDADGAGWEIGVGTYTLSGTTLARTTVLTSSAGGTTKITLSAGTHTVFLTPDATAIGFTDIANTFTAQQTVPSAIVNGTAGAGFITFPHQSSAPTTPGAGKVLLHAFTNNGFTRLEADNEATSNVILGRDSVVLVKNVTGSTMTAGQVVYVTGVTGGVPDVQLARANSASTLPALGVVMDSILTTAIGQVMIGGIAAFDTSGFSTGNQLYVSTSAAGALQSTRPSGVSAQFVQRIGTVMTAAVSGSVALAIAPFIGNLETGTTAATWTGNAITGTTITTSGAIELGNASDTTLARVSAGLVSIEGVNVLTVAGGTLTGNITLGENTSIALDPAGSADGKYSGITIAGTAGEALAFGDVIVLDVTAGKWFKGSVSAAAAADGDLRGGTGMCVLAAAGDAAATTVLLMGTCRADANFPALTIGSVVYATTAGDITVTQPSTTDHVIKVLGFALTADEIMFNPSMDWITHT